MVIVNSNIIDRYYQRSHKICHPPSPVKIHLSRKYILSSLKKKKKKRRRVYRVGDRAFANNKRYSMGFQVLYYFQVIF